MKFRTLFALIVLFLIPSLAPASQLMTNPKFLTLDDAGVPMQGCVYTYEAGGTTAKTTYSEKTLTSANTNPVQCDARGECGLIYFEGLIKIVVTNPTDGDCPNLTDGPTNIEYTLDSLEGTGSSILDFQTCSDYTNLATAVSTIGSTETTLVIDCDATLAANLIIPSTLHIQVLRGSVITLGAYTLTIGGPVDAGDYVWLNFNSTGNLDWNNGQPLKATWFHDPDGTDAAAELQEMVNAAPSPGRAEFVFNADPDGWGVGTALTIPDPGTVTAKDRTDWTFRGEGGKGKLITTAAVNVFQTYDITVAEPAHWTFGLHFKDLELDGADVGLSGVRLHGVAREPKIENLFIHDFTHSGLFLSRVLELIVDNVFIYGCNAADPTESSYGIYACDGTTHKYIGGTINYVNDGFHVDGNITEAATGNDDGTSGITVIGTVIESTGAYAVNIEAGDRINFIDAHLEDCGDSYASAAYCIKISNEGGETPREVEFDGGSMSVDTTGNEEGFYIDYANKVHFRNMQDYGLAGGVLTSNASYVRFESGTAANDMRITATWTLTAAVHDGGDNDAALSVSTGDFVNDGVVAGNALYNLTDASSCLVATLNATTISCTLAGGTQNDWDDGDIAAVVRSGISNQGSTRPLWIEWDQTDYRIARSPGDYLAVDRYGTLNMMKSPWGSVNYAITVQDYLDATPNFFVMRDGYLRTSNFLSSAFSSLTIADGVITTTGTSTQIDTESGAASDDLDTINGGVYSGDILFIRASDSTHSVVVKDGTGNIQCAGDFTMDNSRDSMLLIWNATNWQEISRSNNE